MDRTKLIKKLEEEWEKFEEAYSGLPENELLHSDVPGGWSVRDIIVHVTYWEEEALTYLPVILKGSRPPRYFITYGGIDAFNTQMMQNRKYLSLAELLQRHAETHRRLIEFLLTVPEDQFSLETRFRRRLRLDTYGHYSVHTREILRRRLSGK